MATDWSRDGRFLLFGTLAGSADIWALPMVAIENRFL
jgi:hypothetical protein